MALDISRATIGYSTTGIQEFVSNLNLNVVDELIQEIHNNIDNIFMAVDSVWVGQAAIAFKNKFDRDSEVIVSTLNIIKEDISREFYQMAKNIDNYDAALAEYISSDGNYSFSSQYSKSASNDSFFEKAGDVFVRSYATAQAVKKGVQEGVLSFGESVVDFIATAATVVETPVLWVGDQLFETESLSRQWEQTKAFVEKNYVSGWYDDYYNNTKMGQFIKEEAYSFNNVRDVSKGVGYTAGVVATSLATGGVSNLTTVMPVIGGIAGTGKGVQNAWADGANVGEGLIAGTANGLWEGLQYYAGAKIGNFSSFTSEGANIVSRIGMDAATGGAEGFFQPLVKSIYRDGYYDENGNYQEFSNDATFLTRYKESFNDAGGFANVATNASVGAIASGFGEVSGFAKAAFGGKTDVTSPNSLVVESSAVGDLHTSRTVYNEPNVTVSNHGHMRMDFDVSNSVDLSHNNSSKDFYNYFGDAGEKVRSEIVGGNCDLNKIRSNLSDSEAVGFDNFLNNTRDGQMLQNLSPREIETLSSYSGSAYQNLNSSLRMDRVDQDWKVNYVNDIDNAMTRVGGLEDDMLLTRGVDVNAIEHVSGMKDIFNNVDTNNPNEMFNALSEISGKSTVEKAYMSTTAGYPSGSCPTASGDVRIVYQIDAKKGTQAIPMGNISGNNEAEVLLARNYTLNFGTVHEPVLDDMGRYVINIECTLSK